MDVYTNSTFQVQKACGLGLRGLISKLWDTLITFELIGQSASSLVQRWRMDRDSL